MEEEGWERCHAAEARPCPLLTLLHPWASVVDPRCPHHLQALLTGEWLKPLFDNGAPCLLLQLGDVARVYLLLPQFS